VFITGGKWTSINPLKMIVSLDSFTIENKSEYLSGYKDINYMVNVKFNDKVRLFPFNFSDGLSATIFSLEKIDVTKVEISPKTL